MKVKVCYNNEIHRLAKVPDTLEGLLQLVTTIFHAELPGTWGLQYTDSDGDNIRIASEKDYEEFKNSEHSSTAIAKVHVVAVDGIKQPEIAPEEVIIVENDNKEEEEYQVIQSEEKKDTVPPIEAAEDKDKEIVIQKQEEPIEIKEEQVKEPAEKKVYVDMETLEKLVSAMIEKSLPKISEFTQQQIEKQKGSELQRLLSDDDSILSGLDQPNKPLEVPHYGVRCDECSMSPIMGIRYKCEKCPDFDLCGKCEAQGKHSHHNFIKIKEHSFLSSVRPVISNKEIECFFKPESCFEMKEMNKEEPREERRNVRESMPTAQEITYYDNLVEKVRKMLKVFPNANFDLMCVFVNDAPEDLDMEELIENYKH